MPRAGRSVVANSAWHGGRPKFAHRRCRRRQHRLLCGRLPGAGWAQRHPAAAPGAGRRHRPARPAHLRPRRRRPHIAVPGADVDHRPGRRAGRSPDRARHRQERRHCRDGQADRAPCSGRGDRRQPAERRRQCRCSARASWPRAARRGGHGALQCRAVPRGGRPPALPPRHQRHDADRRRRPRPARGAGRAGRGRRRACRHDGRAVGQAAAQPQQRAQRAVRPAARQGARRSALAPATGGANR